jgi:tripartite-type tricarboxylate transporter receptor subunit TctC
VIAKLNTEINAVLDSPEVRKQFDADGAVIVQMSPGEFGKFFEAELEKWGKVVKAANIKPE